MQPQPTICPNPTCQQPNNPQARFCNVCGTVLNQVATGQTIVATTGATIVPQPVAPSPTADFSQGMMIVNGKYKIEKLLGQGGFGQTYLATEMQLKRLCVIKRMIIDPSWSASEKNLHVNNFEREAKLLAELNNPGHPHIPDIYEYLPQEHCLVMKHIVGQNLGSLQIFDQYTAVQYIRHVCSALVYIHKRNVLHRDIKPDNIMLGDDGRIWLIDFGLSKSSPTNTHRSTGTIMAGTLWLYAT